MSQVTLAPLQPVFTHPWLGRVQAMFGDDTLGDDLWPLPERQHPLLTETPSVKDTCLGHHLDCGVTGQCVSECHCACTDFGESAKPLFTLDPSVVYLNHGSYGAAFSLAQQAQSTWRQRLEAHPCRFVHTKLLEHMVVTLRQLAVFIDTPPSGHTEAGGPTSDVSDASGLAFLPNATSAVNCVVKSIDWKPGDVLLLFDIAYYAVKNACYDAVVRRGGGTVITVSIRLPLASESEVVDAVQCALTTYPHTRLCVFDHITSIPSVVMPIKDIVAMCRARGVRCLVDGAHVVGSLDLHIRHIDPDYYTSNAHKWLCAPKGCAFLYVRENLRRPSMYTAARRHPSDALNEPLALAEEAPIHPLCISHGYHLGFQEEFIWSATGDYSPYLSVTACLSVMAHVGAARLRQHCHSTVMTAADAMRRAWWGDVVNAPPFYLCPPHMNGTMVCIRLPPGRFAASGDGAGQLHTLLNEADIESVIFPFTTRDKDGTVHAPSLWVRLSAQIYNTLHDYCRLRDAITKAHVAAADC